MLQNTALLSQLQIAFNRSGGNSGGGNNRGNFGNDFNGGGPNGGGGGSGGGGGGGDSVEVSSLVQSIITRHLGYN